MESSTASLLEARSDRIELPMPKAYHQIDEAKWNRIKTEAAKAGFPISGDSGHAEVMGVSLRWNYLPPSRVLIISIEKSDIVPIEQALQYVEAIIQRA